jgi:hypothetical protein
MANSKGTLAEFERAFESAGEQALREALGESGFGSTVYHLCRTGVSLADSATRPAEFDDALSTLFNPTGALLLEGKILNRFYNSIGMNFKWNGGRVFKEEVEVASKRFREHARLLPAQGQGGR